MLESIPFSIITGTLLGFLSGLGVGGGSLLILWLTLVIGAEHQLARSINLMFFIPCAIISTIFRRKQGALPFLKFLPAIVGGCIAAGVFSVISKNLDISLLKNFFGVLLLFTGIRELFYKKKRPG